ncbi:MAG: DUF4870 domain-containing protein [Anaerolineaceae bacterium]|nr:DUF4870 domain-containing protein [Anaerolineaceae bacterium]
MSQAPDPSIPPYNPPPPLFTPLTPSDERTWAMLAHLSVLLNLITGILGTAAALVIYLVYKDRSRYVAYQSLQSLVMQLIVWVGGGVIVAAAWGLTGILSAVIVGLACIPFAACLSLLPFAAVVYGVIAGIQCSQGQDFRYWLVGDWLRGTIDH